MSCGLGSHHDRGVEDGVGVLFSIRVSPAIGNMLSRFLDARVSAASTLVVVAPGKFRPKAVLKTESRPCASLHRVKTNTSLLACKRISQSIVYGQPVRPSRHYLAVHLEGVQT
eukprot:3941107-Pleurochrysis_carterae.AAC.3